MCRVLRQEQAHQLEPVGDAELSEDGSQMMANGGLGDEEPLGDGLVRQALGREGGDLALWVRDYGQGVGKAGAALCRGVGLSNTVARLEGLYGAAASLDLQEAGAGVLALIRVPLRTDEGTAPGSPR